MFKKLFVASLIGLSAVAVHSCKKKQSEESQTVTPLNRRIDQPPIPFTEPEDFEIRGSMAAAHGYSIIRIKAGDYDISFANNSSGSVSLNIDPEHSVRLASPVGTPVDPPALTSAGGGVRIGSKRRQCYGIAFNCGFIFVDGGEDLVAPGPNTGRNYITTRREFQLTNRDPRMFYATTTVDANGQTYTIEFADPLNLDVLNQ